MAAHLALQSLFDSPTPTIYELSMSSALSSGLRPAFAYLLEVLARSYDWAVPLCHYRSECFLVLQLVLERHYLRIYDGLFSDNFYGLKRMVGVNRDRLRPMAPRDKLIVLIVAVVSPYIREKLGALHSRCVEGESHEEQSSHLLVPLRKAFVRGYLYALASFEAATLLFQLGFLFRRTPHHTPLDWLLGVVVERLTQDDYRRHMVAGRVANQKAGPAGFLGRLWLRALGALRTALVASALIFKLAEWYFSPETQRSREAARSAHDVVPPPPCIPDALPSGRRLLAARPDLCPLCHEPRRNPAVATSGLVYCYVCIARYADEHGCCPVTGVPCSKENVRRIFASS